MPVKVKCTQCGKVLTAPDAARGKAVKCPQCQTRLAVPAEDSASKSVAPSSSSKSTKTKTKKAAKELDSEASLMAFDMSRAVDSGARICTKCGFDMQYQDEEDTECSQCGFDSTIGGLGAKARKKSMKGPDPADFYPGLFKDATKFLGRNKKLALRTIGYTLVCLVFSLLFAFLFLWISMWPTRVFLALCFLISFLVIPGWMWLLDTEVIKLTLERKDKFKKLNFDFFLSSAMGTAFVAWCAAVVTPLALIPSLIGYALVKYAHAPSYVFTIFVLLGLIPGALALPVCMSHMSMPVQFRGWQFWNVARIAVRTFKPLCYCLLWLFLTNIPNISGLAVIGTLYGSSVVNVVGVMEENAEINRAKFAIQENPNAKRKKKGDPINAAPTAADKERARLEELAKKDPAAVNFKSLIVPLIILPLMLIINGFTCLINMRIHGQFTYYNKGALDLVDRQKEYKYVAKEKVDEDEEALKPKTFNKLLADAAAFVLVFDLFGAIGGMLYGNLTSFGMGRGIFVGVCAGQALALAATIIMNITVAFQDSAKWGGISLLYPVGFIVFVFKNWEERKGPFLQMLFGVIPAIVLTVVGLTTGLLTASSGEGSIPQPAPAAAPGANPGGAPPANPGAVPMNQGAMPMGPGGMPPNPAGMPPNPGAMPPNNMTPPQPGAPPK